MKGAEEAELALGRVEEVDAEEAELAEGRVERRVDEAATWLMEAECFSSGRPFRSKKVSAAFATSAADICSTSLPIISRMRGGMVFSRCSLLI